MEADNPFSRVIDRISTCVGKAGSWLMLVLIGAITYEVAARYFFRNPTAWSLDMTWILYGVYFMLGGSFTLLGRGHVRMDFFTAKLSPRKQRMIDVAAYLIFFFPLMILLVFSSYRFIANSWAIFEKSAYSQWRPPIYPIKALVGFALLLLLLQGVSEFYKLWKQNSQRKSS
jgi:TRAP-type mannitol/chloroaromatic compound transport system permease small subunit